MKPSSAWRASFVLGLLVLAPACKRWADPSAGSVARAAAVTPLPVAPAPRRVAIAPVGDPRDGSVVALGKVEGKTLAFVADEDGLAVRVVDTESMQETSAIALAGRPGQLLVSPTGQLWVTLRDEASVAVFAARDDRTLARVQTFATSAEPLALATVDGEGVKPAVLVVSGWGHALERFDAAAFTRDLVVDLPREPRAVLASRDGSKAFVAHAAHGGLSVVTLAESAGAIANVDLGEAPSFGGSSTSEGPALRAPTAKAPKPDAFGELRNPGRDFFIDVGPSPFGTPLASRARVSRSPPTRRSRARACWCRTRRC